MTKKLPLHKSASASWPATAKRLEMIVDCLENYGVAVIDKAAARRMLKYCRDRAHGARENLHRETEIIDFLAEHGQSPGWVFAADPSCMIIGLAIGEQKHGGGHH
jgi:hypothetical protein